MSEIFELALTQKNVDLIEICTDTYEKMYDGTIELINNGNDKLIYELLKHISSEYYGRLYVDLYPVLTTKLTKLNEHMFNTIKDNRIRCIDACEFR